jgi:hypothetical protein
MVQVGSTCTLKWEMRPPFHRGLLHMLIAQSASYSSTAHELVFTCENGPRSRVVKRYLFSHCLKGLSHEMDLAFDDIRGQF